MAIIKQALGWANNPEDYVYYLSVNPTKDEVGFYKVINESSDENDDSIIKLDNFKDFQSISALDYSECITGMVGVGEKNGVVKVFNVMEQNHFGNNMFLNQVANGTENDQRSLTSEEEAVQKDEGITAKLLVKPKHQRYVNCLSFSSTRSLVAMGLEKEKHDHSLQIWDVNYQSNANEYVNTAFQFFLNESIISCEFLSDTNLLVSSPKMLREVDLRLPKPVFQLPTSFGNQLKVNPFNSYTFATYSENGTSSIWDRRKLNNKALDYQDYTPSLQFDKAATFYNSTASNSAFPAINEKHSTPSGSSSKPFNHLSFRWSTVRPDEFSTLNNSSTIKRWRLGQVPSESAELTYDSLFVSTVNTVNLPFDRVVTFDYIPRKNNKTSFLCMRQSGTVYRCSVLDSTSKIDFSPSNNLISADYDKLEMNELDVETKLSHSAVRDSLSAALEPLSLEDLDKPSGEYQDEMYHSSLETKFREKRDSTNTQDTEESYETERGSEYNMKIDSLALLQNDISMIMRRRANLDYGMEPMSTVDIIDKMQYLQNSAFIRNTWRWLAIAKGSVDDGTMISEKLDIGYEGILGIWNGLDGLAKQNRCRTNEDLTEQELINEMGMIIKMKNKTSLEGNGSNRHVFMKHTKKLVQRKLCMIISGWDFSNEEMEEKYVNLMQRGQYEKAAAWAVFFGDVPKAVHILGQSKRERLKLIATAVAGYSAFQENETNNAWKEQCRKMATELDNPYLRAIFSYISENDWWEILYDTSISLRERLGVALRFLNDKDLSKFLARAARNVISSGELEGLILTGVTPSGVDLLESYVAKTSDVQTAALISIYGSPRYFKDERVENWIGIYRDLLNAWELFTKRSKFDVLRTKLSRNSSGRVTNKTAPRQLYIQCIKCKNNINSVEGESKNMMRKKRKQQYSHAHGDYYYENENETAQQKYSCPHCGTSFPRCAICLLPLGISNLPIMIQGGLQDKENHEDTFFDPTESYVPEENHDLQKEKKRLKFNEWFSLCLTCNHGMHAGHAEEWFERHYVCPVPGCSCQCVYS